MVRLLLKRYCHRPSCVSCFSSKGGARGLLMFRLFLKRYCHRPCVSSFLQDGVPQAFSCFIFDSKRNATGLLVFRV